MVHSPRADARASSSEIHVDLAVLFPDHLLKLPVLPQTDYAAALARAYNAWLVDQWTSRRARRCSGAIVACPQDPDDAAREIERYAGTRPSSRVYLPCAGLDPLWGHRRYDPIFDAAAERRTCPVLLHAVTVTSPVFPFNNHGFDTEFARHATSHTFSIMANVVQHGLDGRASCASRSCGSRVTEAGISWMPFICNRLDKEYLERRREVPFLTERPSHYLKQIYVATPADRGARATCATSSTLMELYDGEDTTMFASDWPHHDFDHPMKLDQVPLCRRAATQGLRRERAALLRIDAADAGSPYERRGTSVTSSAGPPTSPRDAQGRGGRGPARSACSTSAASSTGCPTSARTRPARCARAGS